MASEEYTEVYLTETEQVTLTNFPDLAPYVATIQSITEFSVDLANKLASFQQGTVPYIDALLADVVTKQAEIREVLENITSLKSIPYPLIIPLREMGINLGLLRRLSHLFRENYRGEDVS